MAAKLSYCAEQIRRFDPDRFLCALFAPEAEREALFVLYALNLEIARIPELAREPLLGHVRLRWWIDSIDRLYQGEQSPAGHPILSALANLIKVHRLDRACFDRLLAGRARDLDDAAPPTMADLIAYAEATSASLSALGLRVLNAEDERTRAAARQVAIAWALTGLLRAVPFHARARRVYLPADSNRAAELDVFTLFDRGPSPQLPRAVEPVAAVARQALADARRHCPVAPRRAMAVLLPATLADHHLNQLARAGYDPFHPMLRKPDGWRSLRLLSRSWRRRY